jgi:hypothetical protein
MKPYVAWQGVIDMDGLTSTTNRPKKHRLVIEIDASEPRRPMAWAEVESADALGDLAWRLLDDRMCPAIGCTRQEMVLRIAIAELTRPKP